MKDRNLNPTFEARIAMIIWSDEYAAQNGGVMDFWDILSNDRKEKVKILVDLFKFKAAGRD